MAKKSGKTFDPFIRRGGIVLEVTTKELYAFEAGRFDGRTPKELVREFFCDYDINRGHVARDRAEVGNSKVVMGVRILKVGDEPEIERTLAKRKGPRRHPIQTLWNAELDEKVIPFE